MGFFRWCKRLLVPHHDNAYRPHLLRRGPLMFLLALALVAEGALVFSLIARQSAPAFTAAVIQSEIISLTNSERVQNQVGVLKENALLDRSAQAKADDMAAKGYFAHQSPDGTQPWAWIEAAGYDYQYAGENLAVRFVDSKDVIEGWMASPTHRANIVKPNYTEVGVGIAQGIYKGEPATFVVQHFGAPAAARIASKPEPPAASAAPAAPAAPVSVAAPAPAPATSSDLLGAAASESPQPVADTAARAAGKIVSEPRQTTSWILGGILALLVLALSIAFFHHIQIQARDLLMPGVLVASVALMLMLFNGSFLSLTAAPGGQEAGVAGYRGVVLTPEADYSER